MNASTIEEREAEIGYVKNGGPPADWHRAAVFVNGVEQDLVYEADTVGGWAVVHDPRTSAQRRIRGAVRIVLHIPIPRSGH